MNQLTSNLKLGAKFTLLLLLVFLVGSAAGGMALSQVLQHRAETQVTMEGLMLMQTINSIRNYTNEQVRPLLEVNLTEDQFVGEQVPSFSARQVFERLHSIPDYEKLSYKEAVINPTNPIDLADDFERSLINQFSTIPDTPELSGFRQLPGRGMVFYSARPLRVDQQSCLRCHSTPDVAPAAMLAIYGRENGFGWELGSLIGTQIVYAPAQAVFQSARNAFLSILAIFLTTFALAILALNSVFKPAVVSPIQALAQISRKLGTGDLQPTSAIYETESRQIAHVSLRKDELGQLARVFQRMVQEVLAREEMLRQQIQNLRIEIDQAQRAKEVSDITDTDEFRDLQKKAREYRRRRNQDETP
jgi:HAMP domain-containing protein